MALKPGVMLGQYEVLAHLGSGGMGEVYHARDSKLHREVALKLLPEHFARDPERVARFRREAQLLAQLNHPNIAILYSFEETESARFLVMEYVPGETLRERIKRGPAPVEEALTISKQITEALEHAHAKPIIHRDLKPANVKVTPAGQVKVLDFGLAKAFAKAGQPGQPIDPMDVPTGTQHGTLAGTVLGTPAYMAPEQAGGKEVDKRADLWALGVVLFELLSGKHAFEGETITEIIASVLKSEPDWTALPRDTSPAVRSLLKRCLRKDLVGRFHDPADVRIAIEDALSAAAATEPSSAAKIPAPLLRRWALQVGAAALAVGILVGGFTVWNLKPSPPPGESATTRLTVTLPPGDELGSLEFPPVALSPDGRQLVYAGIRGGTQQLYVRALDSLEAKAIPGTEGAYAPFFSPDGQWIGFFAQGKLRKVSVTGGSSQTLADAPYGVGGSWGPDDTIFFAPFNITGLWKVSASGGQPQEVTRLDRSKGEISHRWPQVLPGGKAVLFTLMTGPGWEEHQIAAQVLETGEPRVLVQGAYTGRYVPTGPSAALRTGHLVYTRAGRLMAVPFDLARLEVSSAPPAPLAEVVNDIRGEGAPYAVSANGSLAYVAASPRWLERRLVWVDRRGSVEALPVSPRPYANPHLSPDGRRVAVQIEEATVGIWIYDLSRATLTRLTSEGSSQAPTWTPDGKRIAYRGTRQGFRNLYWRAADGTGAEERLTTEEGIQTPGSWSPDGKSLVFYDISAATGNDIWVLPMEGDPRQAGAAGRKPQVFLRTPLGELSPTFSPDGRWIAYASDESGRFEVSVQPFPGPGAKTQISTEGGVEPVWARNGRELFYRNGDKMMAVDITTQPSITTGSPRLLFEGRYEFSGNGDSGYDVAPDGQRFLMIQPVEPEQPATQINVVLNWFEELKRRVPVR